MLSIGNSAAHSESGDPDHEALGLSLHDDAVSTDQICHGAPYSPPQAAVQNAAAGMDPQDPVLEVPLQADQPKA